MERVGALIRRMLEQYEARADTGNMILTTQMLLNEFQQMNKESSSPGKNVAVIMPAQPAQVVTAAAATNGLHHSNGHTNTNHLHTATVAPEKRSIPAPERIQPEPVQIIEPVQAVPVEVAPPLPPPVPPAPERKPRNAAATKRTASPIKKGHFASAGVFTSCIVRWFKATNE